MKITLFCNTLNGGGAEHVMKTLCKCFSEKGYKIDFLVTREEGVYIDDVKKHAQLVNLNCKTRYVLPKLIKYLRKQKPNILLSTQTHINIAAIVGVKLSMTKTKIVARETTTLSQEFKAENANSIKASSFYQYIYNKSDKLITVSDGSRKDLINNFKIHPNKIHTIYNPIISTDLYTKANQKINHPWFNNKTPVIVSMGRFAKAKDYPTLLKAFKLVRETTNCHLMILGNSNYDIDVLTKMNDYITENKLNDFISFEGFKKNPFPYLKQSDVFVLSSIYEGLPGALIQAFGIGCQIVSTDCPSGPREILELEKTTSLVKVGDYKRMAIKILNHLKEKKDYSASRKTKMKLFEEDNITEQYLSLFNSLMH